MKIREMLASDWGSVKEIYEEGIATKNATFEESSGSFRSWDAAHLTKLRFVATDREIILGWAALSPVSSRCVYGGVAEVSVYVHPEAQGRGIGTALLKQLVQASETCGIWTLQAGIFPENPGSIRLHENQGFRIVGVREKLGKMNGEWRDVVLLERRSRVAGQ